MKALITGGTGLLGKEILKLDNSIIAPSHAEMDITNLESVRSAFGKYKPDTVLHLAADTNTHRMTKEPAYGLLVNIIGTSNIAVACCEFNCRLVFTSTDYNYKGNGPHKEEEGQFPPYNFGWSKLAGECAVRMVPNHLILRLGFGPSPFPFDKVYSVQYTSKLYADEIAPLVLMAAKSKEVGVMNIGGPRTTLEEYAKRRRKDEIEKITCPDWLPKDVSLDIAKMKNFLGIEENKILKQNND